MLYKNTKKWVLFFFCLCFLFGCQQNTPPKTISGFYFDTFVTIQIYEDCSDEVLNECIRLCQYYDTLLSKTNPESEIYQINHAAGRPFPCSAETISLISEAITYAECSGGRINPTIAGVSSLWNFSDHPAVPATENIQNALIHVDYHNITTSETEVTLSDPETSLDLGFIAKGFIADQIKEYLLSQGIENALINLGGNIVVMGTKGDGSLFHIGIEKPFSNGEIIRSLTISDVSVVTCGIYERYFYENDVLYHHILDPSTGYPVETNLYSVTILSSDSSKADALSTTCFLLGTEEGLALIEETEDAEAMFITSDYTVITSSGFPPAE